MNKSTASFLTIIMLLLLPLSLFSQKNDIFSQLRSHKTLANHGLFSARLIIQYQEDLVLSKRQVEKIEDIILSYEETSIRRGAEIKIFELKLTKQIKDSKVNEEVIENTIREISQLKTDSIIDYINHLFELKKILSQKQINQLKSILKNRDDSKRRFSYRHSNPVV